MQLVRRVVRARNGDEALELPPAAEAVSRDWIEGGVAERQARNRFDLLLRTLERVEGTKHDGWQPVVARDQDPRDEEVRAWRSR